MKGSSPPREVSLDSVAVEIAGARLVATSIHPSVRLALAPASRTFACAADAPDIAATVTAATLSAAPTGTRLLFDSGALWQLWEDGAGSVLRFVSPPFGATPYKTIRLDASGTRAEIAIHDGYPRYWRAGTPIDPFEYPLDELLITRWLSRGRGIELHACGIVAEDGRGYVFCGQSGAGKSTTARSWLGARPGTVLSDDRIVVRFEDGQYWMYGTPWHGEAELATAQRAPLTAVLLIRKAAAARLVPLAPSHAAARLLACAFFPFYDADAIGSGMECVSHLVQQIPCLELELARNPAFIELLQAL